METMKIDNAAKKLEFVNSTGTDKIVHFRSNLGSSHVVPQGHSFVCFCVPILAHKSEGYEESRIMMKKEYNSGFATLQSNEPDVQKIRLYNKDSGKVPTLFKSASKYVKNEGLEFPPHDAPLVDDEKSVDKVWMEWTVGGCHTKDLYWSYTCTADPDYRRQPQPCPNKL